MSCKPGVAGSIPGFSRTTYGLAFGCSHHKIHTQTVNPPGPVLFTAQEKATKSYFIWWGIIFLTIMCILSMIDFDL